MSLDDSDRSAPLKGLGPEIKELQDQVLAMGGFVERSIDEAMGFLMDGSPERFAKVFEYEDSVNQSHKDIDQLSVRIFSMAPVARDLRRIISAIKINGDLERIGDQAVNIAQNGKLCFKIDPDAITSENNEIALMATLAKEMVKSALDAFVESNTDKAKAVIAKDDELDQLNHKSFRKRIQDLQSQAIDPEVAVTLILIARNIERIGDHATNIAEDVIFTNTGEDIRHGGG